MKLIFSLFILTIFSYAALAQDFPFGEYDAQAIAMTQYDKDTAAHAVVLREFGNAFMDNDDYLTINFTRHEKIKIFDSKEFDKGTIIVDFFNEETVKNITGITYYKDDKGVVQHSQLDPEKIYREVIDKERSSVKFTLPNLRNGCVIEFMYTITSPYHYNFHSWKFQADIPKIYSEYDTQVPAFYNYNIILRGPLKLSKKETTIESNCMSVNDIEAGCIKTIYAMDNIPAFKREEYMGASSTFSSGLYFELYAFNNGDEKKTYADDWSKIDQTLQTSERFGVQARRKGLMKDYIPRAVFEMSDTLDKAQAIYSCAQKLIKFNNLYTKYSDDGIKSALDKKTGNAADINLALVAALNAGGIAAEPVILSTTNNGLVSKFYPTISDFNYIIARVVIDNKPYLLDATDPLLSFGLLPLRCVNDQGRVIAQGKPSYWINLVAPEKNKTITTLDITLLDNGKTRGTITKYSFGYAAYNSRQAIKKFNTVDEYVENMDENMPRVKILKSDISNLDSLNLPLSEKYEIEIDNENKFNNDMVEFRPAFWSPILRNPFKLDKRIYPLYMGYITDDKMILTMHYPGNITITNQPAAVNLSLPQGGGSFASNFLGTPGLFTYSEMIQINRSTYSPEEYPYLKELYNKIIQTQKATIALKRNQ